ncbi:MAG: S41 family peptidase [Candidatus Acetothermia bacterium]
MKKYSKTPLVLLLASVLVVTLSSGAREDSAGGRDDLGPLLETFELIRERYYDPEALEKEELLKGAIEGVLKELPDDYNAVYDEEEYDEYQNKMEGDYVGVGMEIGTRDDSVEVVSVFPGTPAARSGLRPGDVILAVEGESMEKSSVQDVTDAIKGEKGTDVTLRVEGTEGKPREVVLTRKEISISPVELEFAAEGKIAVLDVNLFNRKTPEELEERLKDLEKRKGLAGYILDLRNNSGGLLNSALSVASKFVDEGLITELESPDDNKEYESSGNDLPNLPLAVLIDEGTASASELVAAAVRGNGVGVLVGRNSFGKGLVQTTHDVGGGLKVKISSSRYLTPNGKGIPDDGLKPDIEVSNWREDLGTAVRWIEEQSGDGTSRETGG